MKKSRHTQKQPAWSDILEIEVKIKTLSWLLESQDPDCPLRPPWEMQDVNAGLGKMLWEMSGQLTEVRRDLEREDIEKARKSTRD